MGKILPFMKFIEICGSHEKQKISDPRSSENPKDGNYKKKCIETHLSYTTENQNKDFFWGGQQDSVHTEEK